MTGVREACATSYLLVVKKKDLYPHLFTHCVTSYANTLILSGMPGEAESILREVRWINNSFLSFIFIFCQLLDAFEKMFISICHMNCLSCAPDLLLPGLFCLLRLI